MAFLYPGQGSQHPGMGRALYDAFPEAREVFDTADRALEKPISEICFSGTERELRRTENTQPAILATSVAAHRVLESRGLRPGWMAGHSLGEYSALVAARSLDLADAARLVHNRGRYMQEAVQEGAGAMAAILGLDDDRVAELCASHAGEGVVEVANLNAPGQVVVAGDAAAVEALVERARDAGARRAIPLDVSAPFHCSLMEPAARRLEPELAGVEFSAPAVPVITNVDARPVTDGSGAREALVRQVTGTVRWAESLRRLASEGVEVFVEVGPGTVLAGLVRRTLGRDTEVHGVSDPDGVEEVAAALGARERRGRVARSESRK